MKLTGLILVVIGLAAAMFSVVNVLSAKPPDATKVGTAAANPDPAMPMVVPVVVALAGIGIGGGILMFGGKGYDHIPDPAVRN